MNRRTMLRLSLAVITIPAMPGLIVPALAADAKSTNGVIELVDVWSRANGPTERTVYLDILNHGSSDDRLIGVNSTQADKCIFEESKWKGLTVHPVPVDSIPVPAMSRTRLRPGGTYIRAFHLTQSEDSQGPLPMTLVFAKGGEIDVIADLSMRMLGPR